MQSVYWITNQDGYHQINGGILVSIEGVYWNVQY